MLIYLNFLTQIYTNLPDLTEYEVVDPGGARGRHAPSPAGHVKISHKKDGLQRRPYRFHVIQPPLPLPGRWIRY